MKRPRIHGVAVETVQRPDAYTRQQIQMAVDIAHALNRGKFVLAEPAQGNDR